MTRTPARASVQLVSLLAGLLAASPARAQSSPGVGAAPPWRSGGSPFASGGARGDPPPATSGAAPSAPAASLWPARRAPISDERYGTTPDPGITHVFQMPTARPLPLGDTAVVGASDLGWVGLRHSFAARFDAGVGLAYYLAGLSIDARFAVVRGANAAVSLWGYATVPLLPGNASDPSAFAGFTWQGGGAAWAAGPVASLWNGAVAVHFGAHAAQRVMLGGAWVLAHASFEARVSDGIKWLAQGVMMAELVGEHGPAGAAGGVGGRELIGNAQPRVLPYALTGVRLHARRFAIDVGVLVAIGQGTPMSAGAFGVWPWTSIAQYF